MSDRQHPHSEVRERVPKVGSLTPPMGIMTTATTATGLGPRDEDPGSASIF